MLTARSNPETGERIMGHYTFLPEDLGLDLRGRDAMVLLPPDVSSVTTPHGIRIEGDFDTCRAALEAEGVSVAPVQGDERVVTSKGVVPISELYPQKSKL